MSKQNEHVMGWCFDEFHKTIEKANVTTIMKPKFLQNRQRHSLSCSCFSRGTLVTWHLTSLNKDSLYKGIANKNCKALNRPSPIDLLYFAFVCRQRVEGTFITLRSHQDVALDLRGRLSFDQMTDELHSSEITRIIATFWFAHVHMVHVNRKEFSNSWI